MTETIKRLRGLNGLVQDVVDKGSHALEQAQRQSLERPLAVAELVPRLALAARVVRVVHGAVLAASHESVRGVTRAVGVAVDAVLDAVDQDPPPK